MPPPSAPLCSKTMPGRLTLVGIPLIYALCAALWIIFSGYLLTTGVDDPILQGRIEIGKGPLFVAVICVLLYSPCKEARRGLRSVIAGTQVGEDGDALPG